MYTATAFAKLLKFYELKAALAAFGINICIAHIVVVVDGVDGAYVLLSLKWACSYAAHKRWQGE